MGGWPIQTYLKENVHKTTPLNLGTFSTTSLRMLKGSLGAKNEIITGGYGRETYNHWFK